MRPEDEAGLSRTLLAGVLANEADAASVETGEPQGDPTEIVSIVLAALAHLAVLHVGFLQRVFRTGPLAPEEWGLMLVIGTLVIVGGELDKWWNRRRGRLLG